MNTRSQILLAICTILLAGCGGQQSSTAPAAGTQSSPRTVEISAGDNMKYDVTSIDAKAGEWLDVVLTNTGSLPKEAMGHDWVLLKAGADADAFDRAAAQAKATDYLPSELQDEVLAKIDLLGPRKSGDVTFQVPAQPGSYTYLCTFPAHYQNGMKGTLVVQ